MSNSKLNYWFTKIDRTAAWILLVSIILYFVSGYGMTKGIISRESAGRLHKEVLPLIAVSAFCLHTFFAIRLAFLRWRMLNKYSFTALLTIYLIFFTTFFYFELFYNPASLAGYKSEGNTQNLIEEKEEDENNIVTSANKTEKTFTLGELEKYNGKNGMPAYAVVDGVVYDLTKVFNDGSHYSHIAGQELTEAFYSKHVKSQITKYPVVGRLSN